MAKGLTFREANLVDGMVKNLGKTGKIKPLGKVFTEAGYSKHVSRSPNDILKKPKIADALSPFIKALEKKRELALKHLTTKKLKKSRGIELAHISDLMTKQHQLLTGGKTENIGIDTYSDKLEKLRRDLMVPKK